MGNKVTNCIEVSKCEFKKPYVHLVYNEKDGQTGQTVQGLIPLKSTHLDCLIYDGVATMNLKFEFDNQFTKAPVETTLEFPCDKKTIITKVLASIDDRVVEAKVDKKEQAIQKYDDAVASGNTATLVEQMKNDEGFTLKLGNLHPGKSATVNIQLSKFLEVEAGAYAFRMPTSYFPDYSALKKTFTDVPMYTFTYKLEIKSFKPITYLSAPENTQVEQTVQQKHVVVTNKKDCQVPRRDQMLYFKTSDMGLPNLKAQYSDKYPDEVALLTSFVPTFEQKQPQESIELFEDEMPEQNPLSNEKYCFIFLIDRSASMRGDRIRIARNALMLFLKSLPRGSTYQVTSFGTSYKNLSHQVMTYDDDNLTRSLGQVEFFDADFGGTNIIDPLTYVTEQMTVPEGYTKRVFLLTDGQVRNRDQCIDLARKNSEHSRVFTFGIGGGCDKKLVEETSKAGRGTASFAEDQSDDLRSLVIKALKFACEPSLKDCKLQWNDNVEQLGELFRNELITSTRIIKKSQFEAITVQFKSSEDPVTKESVQVGFDHNNFEVIDDGDILFKHGAQSLIKTTNSNADKIKFSIQYQVLCDQTAMVAVVKQQQKTTGELKEYNIPLGKLSDQTYQAPVAAPKTKQVKKERNQRYKSKYNNEVGLSMQSEMMSDAMDMCMDSAPIQSYKQQSYKSASFGAMQSSACYGAVQSSANYYQADSDDLEARLAALMDDNSYSKPAPAPTKSSSSSSTTIPTLDQLINQQVSAGNWTDSSASLLLQFFTVSSLTDKNLQAKLQAIDSAQATQIWYTILALYILENKFDYKSSEWEMIARKANTWLKSKGVTKPNSFIKEVSFTLK